MKEIIYDELKSNIESLEIQRKIYQNRVDQCSNDIMNINKEFYNNHINNKLFYVDYDNNKIIMMKVPYEIVNTHFPDKYDLSNIIYKCIDMHYNSASVLGDKFEIFYFSKMTLSDVQRLCLDDYEQIPNKNKYKSFISIYYNFINDVKNYGLEIYIDNLNLYHVLIYKDKDFYLMTCNYDVTSISISYGKIIRKQETIDSLSTKPTVDKDKFLNIMYDGKNTIIDMCENNIK